MVRFAIEPILHQKDTFVGRQENVADIINSLTSPCGRTKITLACLSKRGAVQWIGRGVYKIVHQDDCSLKRECCKTTIEEKHKKEATQLITKKHFKSKHIH